MQSTLVIHHLYQIKSRIEKEESQLCIFDKVPLNLSIFSFMKRFLSKELRSHVLMFRNRAQPIEEG